VAVVILGDVVRVLLAALVVMAGCTTGPTTDQTPLPTTIELGSGPAVGTGEAAGIVVEIWLDRAQVRVGDVVAAVVRVSNRGDRVVQRETNTCGSGPAQATVVQRGINGQPSFPLGKEWPGLAGEFKSQVLSGAGFGVELDLGPFVDATMLDRNVACADFSEVRPFGPGDSDHLVLAWRAVARQGSVLPAGQAVVRATFGTADDGLPGGPPVLKVTAEAPIEIVGPEPNDAEPAGLTLVDYVDSALSDAAFREWLESAPEETWINPLVSYWPTEEGNYPEMPPFNRLGRRPIVEIGLFRNGTTELLHSETVDQLTGEVLASRTD
jgi:hypothetical protein